MLLSHIENMDVVYWESDGYDEFGKPAYKLPVQIKCNWTDKREIVQRVTDASGAGTSILALETRAIVHSSVIIFKEESWLLQGAIVLPLMNTKRPDEFGARLLVATETSRMVLDRAIFLCKGYLI